MKILLGVVYYEHAWAYGGPPRVVFDLARALVQRGHDVTVVTTDALDQGKRIAELEEVSHGVRVVRFRNLSNRVAFHLKIFLPLGMRSWLRQHVREYDVVHLFDARTLLNGWAAEAAVDSGVPFFASVWGSLPRGDGWRGLIKDVYDHSFGPTHYHKAAGFLAQNEHEAELYAEYGAPRERIQIWPLAVDPADFDKLPARGAFRARLGIGADVPLVLFVGRIHELKGLDPLLRAFAAAKRKVPAAQIAVVGRDDGYLAQMNALARELGIEASLHFVGPLYGDEVIPAYVDASVFAITPTHFEETSLASLAACAAGTPILINDRCGVPWLDEYDAGRCVPHSQEALNAALSELLADRAALARMGANARRMIAERFLMPRVVDQLVGLYRGAAERYGAAGAALRPRAERAL
jgi:glycosyltransferase involved in cell wall biosynthesis